MIFQDYSYVLEDKGLKNFLDKVSTEYLSTALNNKSEWLPFWENFDTREKQYNTNEDMYYDGASFAQSVDVFKEYCSKEAYDKIKYMDIKGANLDKIHYRPSDIATLKPIWIEFKNRMNDIIPNKHIILSQVFPMWYKKYKELNGYMGWHTNENNPGDRWYFVYNTDDNSSCMRFIDPLTDDIITKWEPKGWSLNHFTVRDKTNPTWHCVYTKTNRFSFGLRSDHDDVKPGMDSNYIKMDILYSKQMGII